MPLIHQTPISMKALNYNIDDDLIMGTSGFTAIRRGNTITNLYLIGGVDYQKSPVLNLMGVGGHIQFSVTNAAKTNAVYVMDISGETDDPEVNWFSRSLINVKDPTAAQGVATKNYVDTQDGVIDAAALKCDGSHAATTTTVPIIKHAADNALLQFLAGTSISGKGSILNLWGADHATHPGEIGLFVPNAAKSTYVQALKIAGVTDTPVIDMLNHRVAGVAAATTAGDAIPFQAWATWTPTLTWTTGTPASLTTTCRWTQLGNIVFFNLYLNSADSNGCTNLTFTLPSTPSNTGCYPIFTARELYGVAGTTYANITFYGTQSGADNLARTNQFQAATDGQRIQIICQGFYEV